VYGGGGGRSKRCDVAELGARKEKYKAMENEGKKLPATWKSLARLGEEEKKEADVSI